MCVCITAGNVLIFCALFKENLALMTFRLVLFCSASNYLTHFSPLSVTCSVAPDRHVQLLLLPCFVLSFIINVIQFSPSTRHSICLGVLLCPVETNSDKPCDEKAGSSFTTLCLVSIHANPWTQSKWCVFMNWPSKMLEAVQQTIYLIFKPFVICVFLVFWCVLLSQSKLFSYGRFLVTTRRTQV